MLGCPRSLLCELTPNFNLLCSLLLPHCCAACCAQRPSYKHCSSPAQRTRRLLWPVLKGRGLTRMQLSGRHCSSHATPQQQHRRHQCECRAQLVTPMVGCPTQCECSYQQSSWRLLCLDYALMRKEYSVSESMFRKLSFRSLS